MEEDFLLYIVNAMKIPYRVREMYSVCEERSNGDFNQ